MENTTTNPVETETERKECLVTLNTEQISLRGRLYHKISALRAEIMTKDWADDKMYHFGQTQYSYLSADKVKKTLGPLFAKHGLELRIEFQDLKPAELFGNFTQHWVIKLKATLVDIDTGEEDSSIVYGEAADMSDKSISKAQTSAFKQWAFAKFSIADGIDPDADGGSSAPRGSYCKSPEEIEAVKSKVLAAGIRPAPPAPVKQTPHPVAPAKAPAVPVAHPQPIAKSAEPVEPVKPAEGAYEPSDPQKRAIKHITETWFARLQTGEVTGEQYNQVLSASVSLKDQAETLAFIKNYRVV